MIDHLSSSQISLYSLCSLKYRFQYVDKIPKIFKPSGLAFGSAIHSALSWLNKQRMNGNNPTLEKLFRIFNADWYSQNVDTEIRFKNGEDKNALSVMAKELLAQYFHSPYKKVEGSEIAFVLPLVNPGDGKRLGVDLEGFIDLLEEDDAIVEFKTSAQTANQSDIDSNIQLTTYSYAYEMLTQRAPRLIKLVNFVKTKKPKIEVYETKRTQADYQRLFGLASQVLSGIRLQIFFPRMGFWCKDCEYGHICRDWRGD